MCRCFWLFSFLIVLCGCDKIDLEKIRDLRIIAHRGGTTQYPENSLAAIANAINLGVDAIEIDIRLCKDSTIVVCHDDNIDRVTNGSGKIKDMTYEEILAFSLEFEGTLTDQVIPTLDDVLQLVDMKVELYIEIKDGQVHVEPYEYYDRNAILTVNATNFTKLINGKLDPVIAFTTGKLKVDGDVNAALELIKFIK